MVLAPVTRRFSATPGTFSSVHAANSAWSSAAMLAQILIRCNTTDRDSGSCRSLALLDLQGQGVHMEELKPRSVSLGDGEPATVPPRGSPQTDRAPQSHARKKKKKRHTRISTLTLRCVFPFVSSLCCLASSFFSHYFLPSPVGVEGSRWAWCARYSTHFGGVRSEVTFNFKKVNVWTHSAKGKPETTTKTNLKFKVKAQVKVNVSGCEQEERTCNQSPVLSGTNVIGKHNVTCESKRRAQGP